MNQSSGSAERAEDRARATAVAFTSGEVLDGSQASAIKQESTGVGHRTQSRVRAVIAVLLACFVVGADSAHGQADLFQDATALTPNLGYATANDAFTSTGEPLAPGSGVVCNAPSYTFEIDRTFWWRVIGTGGPIALSTWTYSNIDTAIAVYQANAQPATGTVLDCNDDEDPTHPQGWSGLRFQSVKGATYYTQWGNCANSTTMPACPGTAGTVGYTALTNDLREFADPGVGDRTNIGATIEVGEKADCKGVPYGETVWFSYDAPAAGSVLFQIDHGGDHVVAVYRGAAFFDCNIGAGGSAYRSQMTVPNAAAGERFFVQVGGRTGGAAAYANFTYSVSFTENKDIDGDGYQKPPGPDCDDSNAAIHPGARDVPGNRVDEDCAGGDAPFPRLLSTVEVGAKRGRLTLLRAKRVPAGATIRVTCNRRRCVRRSVIVVSKAGTVTLLGTLRKRRLVTGTALRITITLPGHVGTVTTINVGKKRRLSKTDACLPPGALRPVRC